MSAVNKELIASLLKGGPSKDLSSAEYHGLSGTYSSTQIKEAMKDIESFYYKYVLKTHEKEEASAFDIGTYFHTGLLEPHLIETECAVYAGVRRGAEWEKFKEANNGKAILTESERDKAEALINAVKASPIAMGRLKRGQPEVSAFLRLVVEGSDIYAPDKGLKLTKTGWIKEKHKPSKRSVEIIVKVRADLLAENFILDLKSTSGNVKNPHEMATKVSAYNYDLSAALYLDVFTAVRGVEYRSFIWTFASKDYGTCKNWEASKKNILVGRAKYVEGILNIAEGISNNWAMEDCLGILEPQRFEEEWIKESDTDLI